MRLIDLFCKCYLIYVNIPKFFQWIWRISYTLHMIFIIYIKIDIPVSSSNSFFLCVTSTYIVSWTD